MCFFLTFYYRPNRWKFWIFPNYSILPIRKNRQRDYWKLNFKKFLRNVSNEKIFYLRNLPCYWDKLKRRKRNGRKLRFCSQYFTDNFESFAASNFSSSKESFHSSQHPIIDLSYLTHKYFRHLFFFQLHLIYTFYSPQHLICKFDCDYTTIILIKTSS